MIERLSDSLEAFKRVQDMGLTTAPELRAALREFLQFKGQTRITDENIDLKRYETIPTLKAVLLNISNITTKPSYTRLSYLQPPPKARYKSTLDAIKFIFISTNSF
jgi:hypothetical protein